MITIAFFTSPVRTRDYKLSSVRDTTHNIIWAPGKRDKRNENE